MFIPLIVLFLGSAYAQHRCCGPPQWEAYFAQLEGYVDEKTHHSGSIVGSDIVHYDVTNQRMVTQTFLSIDGQNVTTGIVYSDYKQMKGYIHFGNNCTVAPLKDPMPSNCIPATANLTGTTYLGTGSSKLMLDVWQFQFPAGLLTVSTTQNGCYPVSEGILGAFGDGGTFAQCKTPGQCVDVLLAFGITNMTVGIRDVSIFNMPEICTTTLESHDPIEAHSIAHQLYEVRKRYA